VMALLGAPGIDVSAADDFGRTPLTLASLWGHVDAVKALLSLPGVDVFDADRDGRTALYWAASRGRSEVVILLEEACVRSVAGPMLLTLWRAGLSAGVAADLAVRSLGDPALQARAARMQKA